jgi:hypothetical protein
VAFILEDRDSMFVTCLQAKRADPPYQQKDRALVDISRPKRERPAESGKIVERDHLWQLDALRMVSSDRLLQIAAAYIFYNNGKRGTAEPILPLVKDIGALEPDIEMQRMTDINESCVDLASYIFALMGNSKKAIPTDVENLYSVSRILADTNFRDILCISSNETFVHRLKQGLTVTDGCSPVFSNIVPGTRRVKKASVPRWPAHLREPTLPTAETELAKSALSGKYGV